MKLTKTALEKALEAISEAIEMHQAVNSFFQNIFQEHNLLERGISRFEIDEILHDSNNENPEFNEEYLNLVFSTNDFVSDEDFNKFMLDSIAILLKNEIKKADTLIPTHL